MVIRNYSTMLMHVNLYGQKDLDWRYDETVMSVSVKDLQAYAVYISEDVKVSDGRIHHALVVSARFNPLRIINDLQYLEGGGTLPIVQDPNRRQANVQVVEKRFPESSSDLENGI